METYRDASRGIDERVEDLLARMTLHDKAGLLFHCMIGMGEDGRLAIDGEFMGYPSTEKMVTELGLNHFNLLGSVDDPARNARWYNRLQRLATSTPLGIPVTLSSDPRHHFTDNILTAFQAGGMSTWPDSLGFAALRDPELVRRFADIARQEYLAVGIRVGLHPQLDVATEPRWDRILGTFGEDAGLVSMLGVAYIQGFQGPEFGPESVAMMAKHFPGNGPQKDGGEPHLASGAVQEFPGRFQQYHLEPFWSATRAGVRQIMPCYAKPVGTDAEEVGYGFNRDIITGLLRETMDFDGIVCTDWGLVTDDDLGVGVLPARAWGVEHLSEIERVQRILDAGVDQIGGEQCPDLVVRLVESGNVSMERLDVSVRRLLREKFALGLFDDPYVDEGRAVEIVGRADWVAEGFAAQAASVTVLTNGTAILPLPRGVRVYAEGFAPELLARYAEVVDTPQQAQVALLRMTAPHTPPIEGDLPTHLFHIGPLEYGDEEKQRQAAVYAAVPTVVDMHMERPAVVPEVASRAAALVANFGCAPEAVLAVLFGEIAPRGRLPFDMPGSTAAIENAPSDVPFNTAEPLFRFGHGLTI